MKENHIVADIKINDRKKRKLALMFPGQGSQFEKMGQQFLRFNDKYMKYFDISSSAVKKDILKIINGEDPANTLEDTRFSQIAIYTLSCVLYDYIKDELSLNMENVDTVLGHSLGEYSALYACGAYDFKSGARLVSYRGEIMSKEDKNAKGMMAAVLGADPDIIKETIKAYKGKVFIANYNDYTQIVLSGYKQELKKTILDLKNKNIKKVIPLKLNTASHCPLMENVSKNLELYIEGNIKFKSMDLPFFSTTEISYKDKDGLRETLAGQLLNPIRWVDSINHMLEKGIGTFIEIGPGKVLSGLVRRIAKKNNKDAAVFNTNGLEGLEELIEKLQEEEVTSEA